MGLLKVTWLALHPELSGRGLLHIAPQNLSTGMHIGIEVRSSPTGITPRCTFIIWQTGSAQIVQVIQGRSLRIVMQACAANHVDRPDPTSLLRTNTLDLMLYVELQGIQAHCSSKKVLGNIIESASVLNNPAYVA